MTSNKPSKKIKLSETGSSRNFQECWTSQYGVIEKNGKALCILCDEKVVSRTWNVKRHFASKHQLLAEKNEEERKQYIAQQLNKKNKQSDLFCRFLDGPTHLTSASFSIAQTLVHHAKAFSDGEVFKSAFMNCAPFLFDDFKNRDSIIKRIGDLPLSRNTIKNRVLTMHSNIEAQIKKDLDCCEYFSICLDETTDVTSAARLAIFARYSAGDEMIEELLTLETLATNTTGKDIYNIVKKMFQDRNINMSKIVSVTTDGAPNMVGKNVGFTKLFTESVGHPIVPFHCIIHQEVLCAKVGLKELNVVMVLVTKVVNLIAARALHKREFSALLNEVDSVYCGLLMYNNVRWLSRGKVLERFVNCLEEIKLFLNMKNIEDFPELNDVSWLSRLMFFTDLSSHLNELNVKLQGYGKTIDVMFSIVIAFESKFNIFQRDLDNKCYKYFPNLLMYTEEFNNEDEAGMENARELFSEVLVSLKNQFLQRFAMFRDLETTINFIKYPDQADFTKLKLDLFEWLDLNDFEMELVDFQSSFIWKQKFINLRSDLESLEINRLHGDGNSANNHNQNCELLHVWNSLPDTFGALKRLSKAMLTIFSSTYTCETLFSSLNNIKTKTRNRLTDDVSYACVGLKNTHYKPDIKELSSKVQQQKKQ